MQPHSLGSMVRSLHFILFRAIKIKLIEKVSPLLNCTNERGKHNNNDNENYCIFICNFRSIITSAEFEVNVIYA